MFNFACNFFLVHQWGFSDTVTQHLPLLFRERLRGLCTGPTVQTGSGSYVLPSTTWSSDHPPSKLRVCEALVSQITTLLEPKSSSCWVICEFFLSFFFFLLEVDCAKQAPSSAVIRTSLAVMCTARVWKRHCVGATSWLLNSDVLSRTLVIPQHL